MGKGSRGLTRAAAVGVLSTCLLGFGLLASGPRVAAASTAQVLVPTADTYVDSGTPGTALGTQSVIVADASPTRAALLRFSVPQVSGTITAATLRLHVQDSTNGPSPAGGTIRKITSNAWSEAATTYNNQPSTSGTTVGTLGAVVRNTWYELNALAVVAPGSILNLAVVSSSSDGAYYDSRESGANAPQLVLTIETQPTSSVALQPVADTYVESGTAAATNFGSAALIVADASPVRQAYLRFDLRAMTSIVGAHLQLHVTNDSNGPSPAGGTISRITGSWAEATTTYNTRPALGATVASLGAVTANAWVDVDVTAAVAAGAYLDLAVTSTNTDGAYYSSRESGITAPQLIVTTAGQATASPATTASAQVTPTPTAAPAGILVAAVGDMACAPTSAVTSTACRQLTVSNIIQNDAAIQYFLALGDLQYPNGELANFQAQGGYDGSYGRFKGKTRPAPGNHEYNTAGATGYYTYFGALAGDPATGYYSFDVGTTWHLIALNSNCTFVDCAAGSTQELWLRGDLAASTRPCTIAYWHHPRWVSTSRGDNTNMDAIWRDLAADGAELALAGHEHLYERFGPMNADGGADPNGVRELVVGTGGNSQGAFSTAHANSMVRLRAFAVLKLTLGTSSYAWQLINESGTTLDSGSGTCH